MTALAILGWTLLVPGALLGLVLPALLIALSFRRRRPRVVLLGTARFFGDPEDPAASRSRRELSAARWCAVAAITLAVLAAGRPRPEEDPSPAYLLTGVVDRSPSMFLPADPALPDGERRIDRALAAAQDWLEGVAAGGSRVVVRWRSVGPGGVDVKVEGAAPPSSLAEAPARPLPAPVWGRFSGPGVFHVTDRHPAARTPVAGAFCSGGAAVPGPVAAGPEGLLVWSGDPAAALERAPLEAPLRVFVGEGVPAPLGALARLWAEERGYAVGGAAAGAALGLVRAGAGGAVASGGGGGALAAGREGWAATFAGYRGGPMEAGSRAWLTGSEGEVLVAARPGQVSVDCSAIDARPDAAEAFAVSWSGLFDGHLLAPPEVVSLEERRSAGPPSSSPPSLEGALDPEVVSGRRRRVALGRAAESLLAALAAGLGVAALVLRLRGSA